MKPHLKKLIAAIPVASHIPQGTLGLYRKELLKQALSSRSYMDNVLEAASLYKRLNKTVVIYAEIGTGVVLLNPKTQREATHHGGWDLWSNGPARQGMRHYNRSTEDTVKWLSAPHANSKFDHE